MGIKHTIEELWKNLSFEEQIDVLRRWSSEAFFSISRVRKIKLLGVKNGWVVAEVSYETGLGNVVSGTFSAPYQFVVWKTNGMPDVD